jgi:ankyrin repeat protein
MQTITFDCGTRIAKHKRDFSDMDDLVTACIEGNLALLMKSTRTSRDLNRRYRNWPPVRWAIQEGHLNIVKYLVTKGVSVTRKYSDGFTPLDQAVGEGHKKIVAFLLNIGVNVNQKTINGTALHTACAYGKLEIAKMLVRHGADTAIKDSRGWTPRSYAGYYGRKKLIDFLDRLPSK